MIFTYKKNGKLISTEHSDDLIVLPNKTGEHYVLSIRAKEDITLVSVKKDFDVSLSDDAEIFFNGYQSWTDSKEVKINAKEKNIYRAPSLMVKTFAFDKYGDASFYNYKKYLLHGYDICYCKKGQQFFLFNKNFDTAYLLIEYNKRTKKMTLISDVNGIKLFKGEEIKIFDYIYSFSYEQGLQRFHESFPYLNNKKIFGYTSWYNYYQNINEEIILRDLDALDERFELFQIDDGYQKHVGDWKIINNSKFPNGLKPIVNKIHDKGYLAGIWLAPFVAEKDSDIFINHPEYLKKDKNGEYLKCGSNWSGSYALDFEKQEVRDYIKDCLRYFVDLGFDFFKLDFLYAVGLEIPEGYSRCQYQYKAYHFLREILKDKIILGCGANIINSYGNFDYLRIGPDVSLKFDDVFYMKLFHRERISTKTTLQNTIFRSLFHNRLFANDSDVFLLRDDNIELNKEQRYALANINSLFSGLLMTSDNIAKYDKKKNEILDKVLDNFLHAKNVSFCKREHVIDIKYELDNKVHELSYDFKKGVLINGR